MPIHLYNTLTRSKVELKPRDKQNVRMYVCGPTVYDFAHIGNARPVVVFDVLYRLLRHEYGEGHVKYVRNITDVDDKIIAAAKESGEEIDQLEKIRELTRRTTNAFHEDMTALGVIKLEEKNEPRATQYIDQMIAMIERLIERGHAYVAEDHVLFSVPSRPGYGRLSRHNRQELIEGARVEVAPYKRDPADFVLWKPSTAAQPGWDSPWGRGRPGWHIECSAMSAEILGEHFDIHGGGQDLIFPHHENELAQSVCAQLSAPADGEPFVNIWMHNGYVVVGGEKMSKSLGNFLTVRQLLEEGVRGEAIRLALLTTHYRRPLDISRERIESFKLWLDRLYGVLRRASDVEPHAGVEAAEYVLMALKDDMNTWLAFQHVDQIAGWLDKDTEPLQKSITKATLLKSAYLLGILQQDPEKWFKGRGVEIKVPTPDTISTSSNAFVILSDQSIQKLIDQRTAARKARNFAEADRIRDELAEKGIVLEDGPTATDWRRA